jgi:cyclohexa-1,5-dienecarbonyl-CoA hydratase
MTTLVRRYDERAGQWVRLVLDAPRGNLLSMRMVQSIREALALVAPGRVKWVTIEGTGGEFSFGADIREHRRAAMPSVLPATLALLRQLLASPVATAALVSGRCLGGGFELALCCDDIIATPDAVFGLPEIMLAAFPPAAAALLPLRVGASRASRAIISGDAQPAAYWHEAGLVSMVAPQATLLDAAGAWFDRHLASRSGIALSHAARASRLVVRAQAEPALTAAERQYLDELLETRDGVEGVEAWLEKRAPVWRDE